MALETRVEWNGAEISKDMEKAIFKALTRSVNIMQAEAKLLVRKDTTALEASIVKAVDDNVGIVSSNSDYAAAQEFGLRSTANYGFTPFMRPALNNNKKTIVNVFEDEIKKVYR